MDLFIPRTNDTYEVISEGQNYRGRDTIRQ
jgi:hypothetical protein